MKKFSFAVAVVMVIAGMSVSGLSQQQNGTFKVKHSAPEKAPKSAPLGKMASPKTASTANARDLQNIERQGAKSTAPPARSAPKKTGTVSSAKPVRDNANQPINFGATGGKRAGTVSQSPNPYKGRLRQKGPQ
jgi:hypothetical protein